MHFDFARLKKEFPIFATNGLVYLDSASTSQKPKRVIEAIVDFYESKNANIHRGVYRLSQLATEAYDRSRETVRNFINAQSAQEIIFLRGVTEAVNLVAHSFGMERVGAGDQILLTQMEHHSNIVPWRMLADRVRAEIKVVKINENGELDLDHFKSLLCEQVKLVSLAHVSNVLGTVNPIKEIVHLAKQNGSTVFIDGAQAVAHIPVDVRELNCDFYAFSGHKAYGPTGIGVLYAKNGVLEKTPPYQGGGDMIETVSFEKITYLSPPQRYEAGTVNISGAIGLGTALEFIQKVGMENITVHEQALRISAERALKEISGLKIQGSAKNKIGVISFTVEGIHPHDMATVLDNEGVAVRAGHHCAQPLMNFLRVQSTSRASFGVYNEESDIRALVQGVLKAKELFS